MEEIKEWMSAVPILIGILGAFWGYARHRDAELRRSDLQKWTFESIAIFQRLVLLLKLDDMRAGDLPVLQMQGLQLRSWWSRDEYSLRTLSIAQVRLPVMAARSHGPTKGFDQGY